MKRILSFFEMTFLFLLGLLLTPFAYLIWLRWQRHEWKALGPRCSQGYDYELYDDLPPGDGLTEAEREELHRMIEDLTSDRGDNA